MTEGTALLDATEIAGRLGMAKSSIYSLAASGQIPCYRAGKKLRGRRFDLAEVRAALRVSVKPCADGK
jgi:excisionase family DNA binding protein